MSSFLLCDNHAASTLWKTYVARTVGMAWPAKLARVPEVVEVGALAQFC